MKPEICIYMILFAWSYCFPTVVQPPENNFVNSTETDDIEIDTTCLTAEGIQLELGDIIYSGPGQCIGVQCTENKKIHYLRCKPALVRRGCHGRHFDLTKPFPECCPAEVCS